MISLFGRDIIVENKDDFFKILKIAKDWQESKNNEVIDEDDDNNERSFMEYVNKVFVKGQVKKNGLYSLILEGELGGLNFSDKSFKVYDKPKKRTGPKSKDGNNVIFEEKTFKLK